MAKIIPPGNKINSRKNYYKIKIPKILIYNRDITIWKNKKNGKTYKIIIWRDDNNICFKFGKEYGLGSCWETILPR